MFHPDTKKPKNLLTPCCCLISVQAFFMAVAAVHRALTSLSQVLTSKVQVHLLYMYWLKSFTHPHVSLQLQYAHRTCVVLLLKIMHKLTGMERNGEYKRFNPPPQIDEVAYLDPLGLF